MPSVDRLRSTVLGDRSVRMPSASSTSAAPERDEAARLPCFATGTPQAATTIATAVETFSVFWPSPPVPQTSIAPAGATIVLARLRRARAAATTSITVSPRRAIVVRKRASSPSST